MDKRNGPIDCLRGFSIFLVLVTHGAMPNFGLTGPVITSGIYGVAIFFVVSGFLITRTVIGRFGALENVDVGFFYVLRVARIAPCIMLFVLCYYILILLDVTPFVPERMSSFLTNVSYLLTLQFNERYLSDATRIGQAPFNPMWSLSIEETFYLLFPIVCMLARSTKTITVIACLVIAAGITFRFGRGSIVHFWGSADLLALGCLCAIFVNQGGVRLKFWPATIAGGSLIAVACIFLDFWSFQAIGPSVAAIGAAIIVVAASTGAPASSRTLGLAALPFKVMGRASLELYVFHEMIRSVSVFAGIHSTTLVTALTLAICLPLERLVFTPLNRRIRSIYLKSKGEVRIAPVEPTETTPTSVTRQAA